MTNTLALDDLKTRVESGEIDTVLVCIVDMQGRLMGKRLHARHFVEHGWEETHCCNYLLATDLEMATPGGYASTSWQAGYGDYVMKPDLATLRSVPWLEGTAMVLCDLLDHRTHAAVPHAPRAILKRQLARLEEMGLEAIMATELEFFLFEKSLDEIRKGRFRDLQPISGYNEDYHIFQTTKEEHVLRPLRNHLHAAGIPVEGTKGEAGAGQEELNIRCAKALDTADYHTIAKHATKEIAWQQDVSVSFMAKWDSELAGSSMHLHLSLWDPEISTNQFVGDVRIDTQTALGVSPLFRHFLGGWMKHAPELMPFYAPYPNSYKRYIHQSWAPTVLGWSRDNRTAGFRIVGDGPSLRIECRIPGADANPYLAMAATIAAGMDGIEKRHEPPPIFEGDVYGAAELPRVCTTLHEAIDAMDSAAFLRQTFSDRVVDHYLHFFRTEQLKSDQAVTTWERARYFERG